MCREDITWLGPFSSCIFSSAHRFGVAQFCVLSMGCPPSKWWKGARSLEWQEISYILCKRAWRMWNLRRTSTQKVSRTSRPSCGHPQAVGEPGNPQQQEKSGFISENLHIPIKSDCSNFHLLSVCTIHIGSLAAWLALAQCTSAFWKSAPSPCKLGWFSRRSKAEYGT